MKLTKSDPLFREYTYRGTPFARPVTVDFVADGVRGRQVIDHGTYLLGDELVAHCMDWLQNNGKGVRHIEIVSMRWQVCVHTTFSHDTKWYEVREPSAP